MSQDRWLNRTYFTLSEPEHVGVGMFLFISGVFSGAIHIIALLAIFKFRNVLVTPSIVPEIALILGDLTVGGLHPFSGSAAFCNRWIWGPTGCQLYAASGFLFGTFQLVAIPFIAFDRYVTACKSSFENYRTYKCYVFVFFTLFFFVLFWAAMPLVGWGSYAMTRVQIVCTIDWMKIDTPFVSYATAYTMCCFMAPLAVSCFCYKSIYEAYKNRRTKIDWAYEAHIGKIILCRCLVTPASFAIYAVVILFAMIGDPYDIPAWLTVLPPVMVKFAGLFNPLAHLLANPKINAAIRKMLELSYDPTQLQSEPRESVQLTTVGVGPTPRPVGNDTARCNK